MKRTRKLLTLILALVSLVCVCFAFASCTTTIDKPEKNPKVHSVSLKYDGAYINGVLEVDMTLGTLQLEAVVQRDSGATKTAVYASADENVAEVNQDGLVTLKGAGETLISATVTDKKHEFVLIVSDSSASEGFNVVVNGGVAPTAKAKEGEMITITPVIPADKEFVGWAWDDNIIRVSGNTFEMPACDVAISATFVNKLADITVASQPDSNKVAKGSPLNMDGLSIMARSAIVGEEWDVTNDCEYSTYEGDGVIVATYTLGEVTRTVEIEVEEVLGYTVTASGVQANASERGKMNAIPENMDDTYDAYKSTGYIAGQGGSATSNIKFSTQHQTFTVSNLSGGDSFTYYVYSDVTANARITANLASSDYYKTSDATYTGSTPNAVYETYVKDKFSIYLNGSTKPVIINPAAKANAYTQTTGSWAVCGHFNEAFLFDMKILKGWNSIRFYCDANRAPNVSGIEVEFTGRALAEFAPDIEMKLNASLLLTSAPTDLNKDLETFKSTGAVLLTTEGGASKYTIDKEGAYTAIKGAILGCKAAYYFYAEGNGTVKILLTASSSAYYKSSDATYSDSTPNAVREVNFKEHYAITLNGTTVTALDSAKVDAYKQDTGSWAVCQRFIEDIVLLEVEIKAGWNVLEFTTINKDHIANLSTLKVQYQYTN